MSLTRQLAIMAKAPRMGRVKTRLAKGIGAVEAMRFYRGAAFDLLRRVGADSRWQTVLALSPDRSVHENGVWPAHLPRIAQGEGDLGQRMGRLMRDLPPGPVVIVGCDIPDIQARHIAQVFDALGRADTVFGPAEDGGYWLVGMRRRPRVAEIFEHVRWSSEHALADTLANVVRAGHTHVLLERLSDVDTAEDFLRWRRRL